MFPNQIPLGRIAFLELWYNLIPYKMYLSRKKRIYMSIKHSYH